MIKIVVYIDWLIYYYIDTTQQDGSYQRTGFVCVIPAEGTDILAQNVGDPIPTTPLCSQIPDHNISGTENQKSVSPVLSHLIK